MTNEGIERMTQGEVLRMHKAVMHMCEKSIALLTAQQEAALEAGDTATAALYQAPIILLRDRLRSATLWAAQAEREVRNAH